MSVQRETHVSSAMKSLERLESFFKLPARAPQSRLLVVNLMDRTILLCHAAKVVPSFRQSDPFVRRWHTCVTQLYRALLKSEPPNAGVHTLDKACSNLSSLSSAFASTRKKPSQTRRVRVVGSTH